MPIIASSGALSAKGFGLGGSSGYVIDYLIVAGGGGAQSAYAGSGGGAGGYISTTGLRVKPGTAYSLTIGGGGLIVTGKQ